MGVDWLLQKLNIEWVTDDGDAVESTEAFLRRKYFVVLAENRASVRYRHSYFFPDDHITKFRDSFIRFNRGLTEDRLKIIMSHILQRLTQNTMNQNIAMNLATLVYGHAFIGRYDPDENPAQLIHTVGNGLIGPAMRVETTFVRRSELMDLIHSRSTRNDAYASSPDGG